MNKIYFSVLIFLMLSVQSLIGETAKDFTCKDSEGNTYNLYTMLAEGKHVWVHFTGSY